MPWVRLLRLSNGPTALADVWMGYAVAAGSLEPTPALIAASLASLCLYHGGMALNDARDAPDDSAQNRRRPIAQGAISRFSAFRLAYALLGLGVGLATLSAVLIGTLQAKPVGLFLAMLVLAYNSPAKRTVAGPLLMGLCRSFNCLLGIAVAPVAIAEQVSAAWLVAIGIGAYTVGVTVYARDESLGGRRGTLLFGMVICLLSLGWLAWGSHDAPRAASVISWALLWAVTALLTLRGMVAGWIQPRPAKIGRGVGVALQGLILIDGVLATLYAGPPAGLAILALLPVTMLLARSIPQS